MYSATTTDVTPHAADENQGAEERPEGAPTPEEAMTPMFVHMPADLCPDAAQPTMTPMYVAVPTEGYYASGGILPSNLGLDLGEEE